MKRNLVLLVCGMSVLLPILTAVAVKVYEARLPGTLTLELHAMLEGEPLQFNTPRYENPGGEGRVSIRDFQFYLSNIELLSEEGEFRVDDSYHLIRFNGTTGSHAVVLQNVPRRSYSKIRFGIGVDPEANRSLRSVGDLDPNNRMAWNWEVGYKFILFEGSLDRADVHTPLVYHVGFDESYRRVGLTIDAGLFDQPAETLRFSVDVMTLFDGPDPVDMAELSTVKFDRDDASRIAQQFAGLIGAPVTVPGSSLIQRILAYLR